MVANVQGSAMHTYLLSYCVMFVTAFAFPKWSIIKCNPVWWRLIWDNQYTGSGLKLPQGSVLVACFRCMLLSKET